MRYDIFNHGDDYFHVIVSGRIEIDAYAMEIGGGQDPIFIFPVTHFKRLVVMPVE